MLGDLFSLVTYGWFIILIFLLEYEDRSYIIACIDSLCLPADSYACLRAFHNQEICEEIDRINRAAAYRQRPLPGVVVVPGLHFQLKDHLVCEFPLNILNHGTAVCF